MILDKYVEVKMVGSCASYYENLGYEFKINDVLKVRVEDLPPNSNKKVRVKCDVCGEEKSIRYCEHLRSESRYGYYTCSHCAKIKTQKTIYDKYGCRSHMLIPEIAEKQKKTNLERYGVEHAAQSKIVKEKTKKTIQEKYGVDYVGQIEEAKEKTRQGYKLKYGVEYGLQVEEIKKKSRETCFEKYGVENPNQSPIIRKKILRTLYNNQTQQISMQQLYLNQLYKGELNYPCNYYSLDIYLPNYKLDIEYNGGGHNLQVKLGGISEKEFKQKEIIRSAQIRRQGINQFTIISRKDYLPSDSTLLQMLEETLSYLSTTNHHWVEYDIDRSTVRNALGCFPYDFGRLRKITKADVQDIENDTSKEAS